MTNLDLDQEEKEDKEEEPRSEYFLRIKLDNSDIIKFTTFTDIANISSIMISNLIVRRISLIAVYEARRQ